MLRAGAGVRTSGTVKRRSGLYALRPTRNILLGCNALKDGTGFLDLANLVSGGGGAKTAYDELASKIGAHPGLPALAQALLVPVVLYILLLHISCACFWLQSSFVKIDMTTCHMFG